MTDQTYTDIQPGDTIEAEQIMALPEGSVVSDIDGDTYRLGDGGQWTRTAGNREWEIPADAVFDYFKSRYRPYKLHSLPTGIVAVGVSDLYQQARLALRDRYGVEPSSADVDTVQQIMEDSKLDASAAVGALGLSRAGVIPSPTEASQLVAGFGIAVSGGGAAAAETVDTDDSVKGLARLRAHAALDRILDQMEVSR